MSKQTLLSIALLLVLLSPFFFRVPEAMALSLGDIIGFATGDKVTIVGDVSETSITNTIKNTLSSISSALTAEELSSLNFKETVLDPIAWAVAKELQQQLTGNLLKWLGGQLEGQDGQVPFVQNYSDHYQKIADKVAGDFIFGDELSGLCSEEEDFLVKEAVYDDYVKSKNSDSGEAMFQCVGEDEDEDVLSSMVRKIATCNTAICGQYAGRKNLALRQLQAIENETFILDQSGGMLPTRVCQDTEGSNGSSSDCKIVNPLFLAKDSVSFQLTELPGLQLLNMDEFNEVASNLMSNLTNQALTGLTGVLGLTGNSSYGSNNVFGTDGNLSYADALIEDDISNYQSGGKNPTTDSLNAERRYFSLLTNIANEIKDVDNRLVANEAEFSGCFDMELTNDLVLAKEKNISDLAVSSTTLSILEILNSQYENATSNSVKSAVTSTYSDYESQGFFRTDYQNQEFELVYINLEFAEMIDRFKYDMAVKRQSCGGSFDYDGVLGDTTSN